jgi:hypothetical protein
MWVAMENRKRRAVIISGFPVRDEINPAAFENRLIDDRASASAPDDESQWNKGSSGRSRRSPVRRSPNWLLIGRRFVSRCAVRFFTRGTSS